MLLAGELGKCEYSDCFIHHDSWASLSRNGTALYPRGSLSSLGGSTLHDIFECQPWAVLYKCDGASDEGYAFVERFNDACDKALDDDDTTLNVSH